MRTTTIRRVLGTTLALVATAALSACGAGGGVPDVDPATASGGDPALEQLIVDAQAEGSVTWYAARSETIAARVSAAFTERFGVRSEFVRLSSGDIAQRFTSEADAGAPVTDVLFTSDDNFVRTISSEGRLVPLAEAGLPAFPGAVPPEWLKHDGHVATVQIAPWSLAYNTDLVAADEAPTSWEDLVDPRWRGEILLPDPTSSDAYIAFWTAMRERYGDDYLRAFAAQEPFITASSAPALESLAAGERMIAGPGLADSLTTLQSTGAPIEVVRPEFSTGTEIVVGIAADAPRPAAARLLVHFLMSEEGNLALNDFPGIAGPADTSDLPAEYVASQITTAAQRDEVLSLLGR